MYGIRAENRNVVDGLFDAGECQLSMPRARKADGLKPARCDHCVEAAKRNTRLPADGQLAEAVDRAANIRDQERLML